MKVLVLMLLSLTTSMSARADQICVNYNADGTCNTWENTGNGGLTPNYPGIPGNPSGNAQCVCANYDAYGNCSYYINCDREAAALPQ